MGQRQGQRQLKQWSKAGQLRSAAKSNSQNAFEANVCKVLISLLSPQQVEDPGSSLKDSEQQNSVGQAEPAGSETTSDGKEEPEVSGGVRRDEETSEAEGEASNKFYCYICNITCHNQQVWL